MGITGLVAAFASVGGASAAPCPAVPAPADEGAMTALINQQRAAAGVKKVRASRPIQRPARSKSLAMARGARFAHGEPMTWAGARAAAQNIAAAPTVGAAFEGMMLSPVHRENLLNAGWRLTGVGAARNCTGTLFFTVNLVAP